jgi:hypothetical protein
VIFKLKNALHKPHFDSLSVVDTSFAIPEQLTSCQCGTCIARNSTELILQHRVLARVHVDDIDLILCLSYLIFDDARNLMDISINALWNFMAAVSYLHGRYE